MDQCTIEQTSPPVQVVRHLKKNRKGGLRTFEGFFKRKGMLDFEGGFMGKHCALDAKYHNGTKATSHRWNFKSAIAEHQLQRMSDVDVAGGLSGIILAWEHFDHGAPTLNWYGIPYHELWLTLDLDVKSWTLENLDTHARASGCRVYQLNSGPLALGLEAFIRGQF
jgi:penicillin-binding protein-related factor A (putative recombinase)